jgi:aminoacrylate hydrolase
VPEAHVNGIDIHYETQGSGDPVMLLTGLGGAGRAWGDQIDRFAAGFTTIVPDHRGTGQSSKPDGGYTVQQTAADMAETLRAIGTGPAHLVGSSTGGAMAQVMAIDHPDVVRSITLVSSWAKADDHFRHQFAVRKRTLEEMGVEAYTQVSALFLFSAAHFRHHYEDVRTWMANSAAGAKRPDIMAKRIDMIVAFDETDRLGRIEVPALVVAGNGDACTPPAHSQELASLIPGAELVVLETGHFVSKEQPDVFYDLVSGFLRTH